jgi:DNA-binding SARP family transcriptional activator
MICLLGNFRLLKAGQPVVVPFEGKAEVLLSYLALRHGRRVPREELLDVLWPEGDHARAKLSLNSLVYSLHRLLGDQLGGAAPVLCAGGYYRLQVEAGVCVDVACFDALVDAGDREAHAAGLPAGAQTYARAVRLYRGDLCTAMDMHAVVERQRLRNRYAILLARLADYYFGQRDYAACLDLATRLLVHDPCNEDAHRLVMRCYVRRGERTQALRQYQVCRDILQAEFGAAPELATTALFDQARLDPGSI